jgi:opacity protein-like surface antigen
MFALTGVATAADMPQLPPVVKEPVVEFFSPWYVRIDAGYRLNMIDGGSAFGTPFIDSTLRDSGTIGGGVGLKWNWFRTDITFDYGSSPKFEGFFIPNTPSVTAKIATYTTLWNGYFDLGTWWGFTPYLGAGIGFSYLKPSSFALNPATTAAAQNEGHWDFSWAGIAGASYAISPAFLLDLNYRYLDIGDTATKVPVFGNVNYGDLTAHEFRFGLRWMVP